MKNQSLPTEPRTHHETLAQRDQARVEMSYAALLDLGTSAEVMQGFHAITGECNPLRTPCGAEAAGRQFIALHWGDRIKQECDLAEAWVSAAFDIQNPNWRRPAHRLDLPLRAMVTETIPRLKTFAPNIAYAPALRFVEVGDEVICQPALRILMFGLGLTDFHAGSVDGVRRLLGRGNGGRPLRTCFRPLTKARLELQIGRLLEFQPHSRPLGPRKPSPQGNLFALMQVMAMAALPMGLAARGVGIAKTTLSGAMGDWKASLKNRMTAKRIIASNEIYPLLSEVPLEVNGKTIRLPFWNVE